MWTHPINISVASCSAHGIETGDGDQKSETAKLGSKCEWPPTGSAIKTILWESLLVVSFHVGTYGQKWRLRMQEPQV